MDKSLQKRVNAIARTKGILMKDIAKELGITPVSLSQSLASNPTYKRLCKIAEILNVHISDLTDTSQPPKTHPLFLIKDICKKRGIELQDLASMVGIDPASLSRAINGNPRYSTLAKIASALNVDVADLMKKSVTNINGFIEINDQIYKISSKDDINHVWAMINN